MTFQVYQDPGHDRARPGTQAGGIDEERDVFALASSVNTYLNHFPYVSSTLSRVLGEQSKRYRDRATEAKALGARLVICHHINAYTDASGHGLMTFYTPGDALGQAAADTLARCAPPDLRRQADNRMFAAGPAGWTAAAWRVMDAYRRNGLSVMLVEWGFATNPRDAAILLDTARRPELCAGVMSAVARVISLTHGVTP